WRSQGRLFLRRLPPTIHGDGRNGPGAFTRPDLKMADGPVPSGFVQKIPQCQSDSPDDRGDLQNGLVHVSPDSLCDDAQSWVGAEVEGHGGSGRDVRGPQSQAEDACGRADRTLWVGPGESHCFSHAEE